MSVAAEKVVWTDVPVKDPPPVRRKATAVVVLSAVTAFLLVCVGLDELSSMSNGHLADVAKAEAAVHDAVHRARFCTPLTSLSRREQDGAHPPPRAVEHPEARLYGGGNGPAVRTDRGDTVHGVYASVRDLEKRGLEYHGTEDVDYGIYPINFRDEFHQQDLNGDGAISTDELSYASEEGLLLFSADAWRTVLSAFDTDGDGLLQYGEWRPWRELDEPQVYVQLMLADFDTDRNGGLDGAEYAGYYERAAEAAGEEPPHQRIIDAVVRHEDGNGNGKLDQDELLAIARAEGRESSPEDMTLVYDGDGDGRITVDEVERMHRAAGVEGMGRETVELFDADGSGDLDYDEFNSGLVEVVA